MAQLSIIYHEGDMILYIKSHDTKVQMGTVGLNLGWYCKQQRRREDALELFQPGKHANSDLFVLASGL